MLVVVGRSRAVNDVFEMMGERYKKDVRCFASAQEFRQKMDPQQDCPTVIHDYNSHAQEDFHHLLEMKRNHNCLRLIICSGGDLPEPMHGVEMYNNVELVRRFSEII